MHRHINFEDNIFILNLRIRLIRDALALDPDPGLFLNKIVDDINFIDDTLVVLLNDLAENISFIGRDEQFDNLAEIEWQFSQVLTKFLNSSRNISVTQFPALREKILFLQDHSAARRKTIDESESRMENVYMEPVVSSAELSELLKQF
ncbi:MAG: hypothetical protein LBT14_04745 [Treponema sp.]|jgi:hypothetical protein|nr:hypothetical protein [Treponema sp.]